MPTKKRDPTVDLTVRQVAHELGVHYDTIHTLLQRGTLVGYKISNRWRITQKSLDAFKARSKEGS